MVIDLIYLLVQLLSVFLMILGIASLGYAIYSLTVPNFTGGVRTFCFVAGILLISIASFVLFSTTLIT